MSENAGADIQAPAGAETANGDGMEQRTDPARMHQASPPTTAKESTDDVEQQIQSEVDRRVQQALLKREREQKQKDGEFESLYKEADQERQALRLERETAREFSRLGLVNFTGAFDGDLGTIEGRVAFGNTIKKLVDSEVKRQVAERIKTDPPPKGDPPVQKRPDEMTPDEYAAWKKANNIQ